MNVRQLFEFLKNHLESYSFRNTPVRIRVGDREFDILGVSASDHEVLLESDPSAMDALLPCCFKCRQLIDQQSHIKITLPVPMSFKTAHDEEITNMYICERHDAIIDHLSDLYDEGFAGEACDLCGQQVQNDNRTLVYLDRKLEPWRVICAADTREVLTKILE